MSRTRKIVLSVLATLAGLAVLGSVIPDEAETGSTNRDGVTLIPPAVESRESDVDTCVDEADTLSARLENAGSDVSELRDIIADGREMLSRCEHIAPAEAAEASSALDELENILDGAPAVTDSNDSFGSNWDAYMADAANCNVMSDTYLNCVNDAAHRHGFGNDETHDSLDNYYTDAQNCYLGTDVDAYLACLDRAADRNL